MPDIQHLLQSLQDKSLSDQTVPGVVGWSSPLDLRLECWFSEQVWYASFNDRFIKLTSRLCYSIPTLFPSHPLPMFTVVFL